MENGFLFLIGILLVVFLFVGFILVNMSRPYTEIIDMNWSIKLPRSYKEIYSTDSGPSFHGDGWRYHIFEYKSEKDIDCFSNWAIGKNAAIESAVEENLDILNVTIKYRPNFDSKYCYYTKTERDSSKIYLIFFPGVNKLFVIEDII